ncbi:DUF4179 domain-containing protein [Paenibacillus sp. DMB20]|uniref:DUF4179 domain-containing protein n=1 Tax=Paenibacillus sp. DMB20 TaxID=1642570 RepID=UPI00069C5EEA|nr:DUF4179 domain-containing protein [Paenibacillus sp. DMB20]
MGRIDQSELKKIFDKKFEDEPSTQKMWQRIESKLGDKKTSIILSDDGKRKGVARKKWVPAFAVSCCLVLTTVPVLASVNLDWGQLFGGGRAASAIEEGFGQQYNLVEQRDGASMTLHGVVTDSSNMKALLSMDVPGMPDYDVVDLKSVILEDHAGDSQPMNGYLTKDKTSGQLLGIYQLKDELQNKQKTYTLKAEDLTFYKYKNLPIEWDGQTLNENIELGSSLYPSIRIKSVTYHKDKAAIRYAVSSSLPSASENLDPSLQLSLDGKVVKPVNNTMLPPENDDLLFEKVYNLTKDQLQKAKFSFSFLEENERIKQTWSFKFEADGKKASQAIYTKIQTANEELLDKAAITLKQLNITPLSIEIPFAQEQKIEENVSYRDIKLKAGDHTIDGGFSFRQKKGEYDTKAPMFLFESPKWFADWSGVPMKLMLSDAEVTRRDLSRNWTPLPEPSKDKKQAVLRMDEGFDITYTYYRDGNDLIIESESASEIFKGISQSTLRIGGSDKPIYPEMNPGGPELFGKRIERYKDIPSDAKVSINPGFYVYKDKSRNVEVELNKK